MQKTYTVTYNKDGSEGICDITIDIPSDISFEDFQTEIQQATLKQVGNPKKFLAISSVRNP